MDVAHVIYWVGLVCGAALVLGGAAVVAIMVRDGGARRAGRAGVQGARAVGRGLDALSRASFADIVWTLIGLMLVAYGAYALLH